MDGFDFTARMFDVCLDLTQQLPELHHIKMDQVALAFVQARKRVPHGMQASLTPMRFEGGNLMQIQDGREYTTQRLFLDGCEMLYIMNFYLPRFMDGTFLEKIATTLHELWHIGPTFDGDLRRHEGRYYMHSSSEKEYDQQMFSLAMRWIQQRPSEALCGFLRLDFDKLKRRYGRVYGRQIAHPKLIAQTRGA